MEEQIRTQAEKAFWDIVDSSVKDGNMEHIQQLLNEIKDVLKSFVPSRTDIHEKIDKEIVSPSWETQKALVQWIERFQAPVHDPFTLKLAADVPLPLSDFLKRYYPHVQKVHKEVHDARLAVARGENLFAPSSSSQGSNGVPQKMKTGR